MATHELSSDVEQLLGAVNILRACIAANNDPGSEHDIDLSYPLWAAVSALNDLTEREVGDYSKLIEARCIVTASIVALAAERIDWDLSWPLRVAVRLINEVIEQLPKAKKKKPRSGLREIKLEPAVARQLCRLVGAAGELPLAELERMVRYAETGLAAGQPPRRVPPEGATDSPN